MANHSGAVHVTVITSFVTNISFRRFINRNIVRGRFCLSTSSSETAVTSNISLLAVLSNFGHFISVEFDTS